MSTFLRMSIDCSGSCRRRIESNSRCRPKWQAPHALALVHRSYQGGPGLAGATDPKRPHGVHASAEDGLERSDGRIEGCAGGGGRLGPLDAAQRERVGPGHLELGCPGGENHPAVDCGAREDPLRSAWTAGAWTHNQSQWGAEADHRLFQGRQLTAHRPWLRRDKHREY